LTWLNPRQNPLFLHATFLNCAGTVAGCTTLTFASTTPISALERNPSVTPVQGADGFLFFGNVLAMFCLFGEIEPGFGHLLQPAFLHWISGRPGEGDTFLRVRTIFVRLGHLRLRTLPMLKRTVAPMFPLKMLPIFRRYAACPHLTWSRDTVRHARRTAVYGTGIVGDSRLSP
jgi:hypothetical protein